MNNGVTDLHREAVLKASLPSVHALNGNEVLPDKFPTIHDIMSICSKMGQDRYEEVMYGMLHSHALPLFPYATRVAIYCLLQQLRPE